MSLDLVYFTGGPRLSVFEAVLADGHRINHVYVNDPERWPKVQSTIDAARSRGIPVTIISRKAELSKLAAEIRGKICFSAGFNYLFSTDMIDSAEVILNVHGSLLPKYPGARTLAWAIENGESESGVTVHVIDAGMDTGPILLQRCFAISPFETTKSLARKTGEFEPSVVVEALRLYDTESLARICPQSRQASPLENRVPAHSEIDPEQPLKDLVNKIRAADPHDYPAYFYLHGEKVCVHVWRPNKPEDEEDLI